MEVELNDIPIEYKLYLQLNRYIRHQRHIQGGPKSEPTLFDCSHFQKVQTY